MNLSNDSNNAEKTNDEIMHPIQNHPMTRDNNGFHVNTQIRDYRNFNEFEQNNSFDNFDEFEQNDFFTNSGSFTAQLYATRKLEKYKYHKLLPTCLDDTVVIPRSESEKLLMQDNSIVDISFCDNKQTTTHVYAKVIGYSAPSRLIMMPQWMIDKIGAKSNNLLRIELANIKKITMVKIIAPKTITNALGVLEFHLRNRSVLYSGEQILVNMFEKKYCFTINEIFSGDEKIETGILYTSGPTTEVKFDLTVV